MNKILFIIVSLVNLVLIALLLFGVRRAGMENGISLLYLYYPLLIGFNLLMGIIFLLKNSKNAKPFFIAVILLFATLPIFLIACMVE